jgi:hypothetical protein
MSRQYWSETLAWATADGTAVNTTTTETIIFPNVTIPANYLQDGRALRLTAYGRWSSLTATSPTYTWAIRWGGVAGTVLTQTGAIVASTTATTNGQWKMEAILQTRSNGATGTIFGQGEIYMYNNTVATMGTVTNYGLVQPMCSAGISTPAAVTVDLTADTALSFTIDFSASNAANAVTGHILVIEALN